MKKFLLILFAAYILIVSSVPVYAHPGRTDSSGGHTDHSTGEYHYHHGYPAHEHYDIDGDGNIDCPYDFDDQTGVHSGSGQQAESPKNTSTSGKGDQSLVHKITLFFEKALLFVVCFAIGSIFLGQIFLLINEKIGKAIASFGLYSFFLLLAGLPIFLIVYLVSSLF